MSEPSAGTSLCRVVIDGAWLEFMIDGEGDHFVFMQGRVIEAVHERMRPVKTITLNLGPYDFLSAGFHVLTSRGSAVMIEDRAQIDAIQALIAEAASADASLIGEIAAHDSGRVRANGQAHSWSAPSASFHVTRDPVPCDTPPAPVDPEDVANIRAELSLEGAATSQGIDTCPMEFQGLVTTISGIECPDFDTLSLRFDAEATKRRLSILGNSAQLIWPTPTRDREPIHALIERAQDFGRFLLDVDLGTKPLDEAGREWPVTDVSVMARVL